MPNLYDKFKRVDFTLARESVEHLDAGVNLGNVATHGYGSDDLPANYLAEGRWYYLTGNVVNQRRGLPVKFVVQKDSILFFETTDTVGRILGITTADQLVGINTRAQFGHGQCHLFKFKQKPKAWCPEGNERLEEFTRAELKDGDRLVCVDAAGFAECDESNRHILTHIADRPFTIAPCNPGVRITGDAEENLFYLSCHELQFFRRVTVLPEKSEEVGECAYTNTEGREVGRDGALQQSVLDSLDKFDSPDALGRNEVTIHFAYPHVDKDGESVNVVIFSDADVWCEGGFVNVVPNDGKNVTYSYPAHKVGRIKSERVA